MLLKNLSVRGFRNFEQYKTAFKPGINVIVGKNGAGKTNLLEAVFVISTSTSPRTSNNAELVKENKNYYVLNAQIAEQDEKYNLTAGYTAGNGYQAKINKSTVNRKELLKIFPVVMFSPEDVEMLKGAPSGLRKAFNINIAQLHNSYVEFLIKYRKLLKGRNEMLKTSNAHGNRKALKAWTSTLVKYAEKIRNKRENYVKKVNKNIKKEIKRTGIGKDIEVIYRKSEYNPATSPAADREKGYTTWGPQRDRFDFKYDGKVVSTYASRGESRAVSFVYRMATLEMISESGRRKPLVLLDDVFSELDQRKRELISARIENMQSLVTHTEVPGELKGKLSEVIKL